MRFMQWAARAACLACGLGLATLPAKAQEAVAFGGANGWEITQLSNGGQVVACEAMRLTGSEEGLFFRHDVAETMIGFSGYASAASPFAIDVQMWFDGDRATAETYAMEPVTDHNGFTWRALRLPNSEPWGELDALANADTVHFGYDSGDGPTEMAFPLTGSNRATKDTYACAQEAGSAAAGTASQASAGPQVISGSCRLVVDGQVYVDKPSGCPIWLANDGSGGFWINTNRTDGLGDYFAEVQPDGTGRAGAWWNEIPGALHAQSPLGDDFRLGSGGCWSNARATVCAAR